MTKKLLLALILIILLTPTATAQEPSPAFTQGRLTGPLPLSAYPRPKGDNGMGIHWSTTMYGEEQEVTDTLWLK